MSNKWTFLYLSQEDCVKVGGTQMGGAMRATALIIILDSETLIPMCVMDGAIVSASRRLSENALLPKLFRIVKK